MRRLGSSIAKVKVVGLTLEVDPYSKENGRNFEVNMIIWPPLEYSVQSYFFATLSLTQVYVLWNSSNPENCYRVI